MIFLLVAIMLIVPVGCGGPSENKKPNETNTPMPEEQEVEEPEETDAGNDEDEDVEIIEAFPNAEYVAIADDQISAMKEEVRSLELIEEARIDGEMAGYRILITPNGYGGRMEVFTYIDLDGKILQVEIGEHGETEGIGSAVKDPKFLRGFTNISSEEEITAVDGIAGATFSSGGVKDGITRALNIYTDFLGNR